jgi:hypothetical protein
MWELDWPVVLVIEWNTIRLSTCKIICSWMPFVMISSGMSNFDPTTAVCLGLTLTFIDLCLVLLASDGMSACWSCRRWSLNDTHLWHYLIINSRSIICTTMLLHIASVRSSARWSSVEVSGTPSSSTALGITLLKTVWVCVHSFFLSFNTNCVEVVAILLSSFDRSSKFPVAIVLSRGDLVVEAIWWLWFSLTRCCLRFVSLCHIVVWSTHTLVRARVSSWRWVIEFTVAHSVCSLNRKAVSWFLLDRGSEVNWVTCFPSCSWFGCVAPNSYWRAIRISAMVVSSCSSCWFTYWCRMTVWTLHFPSLANLTRNCSRLASSISSLVVTMYSFVTWLLTSGFWSLMNTASIVVAWFAICVLLVYHLALSTESVSTFNWASCYHEMIFLTGKIGAICLPQITVSACIAHVVNFLWSRLKPSALLSGSCRSLTLLLYAALREILMAWIWEIFDKTLHGAFMVPLARASVFTPPVYNLFTIRSFNARVN